MPRSDGQPVLLIPGFMAGDGSLALMTQWLRRLGYRAHTPASRRTSSARRSPSSASSGASGNSARATTRGLDHRPQPRRHVRAGDRRAQSRRGEPCRRARLTAGREQHRRVPRGPAPPDPHPAARPAHGRARADRFLVRAQLGGVQVRAGPDRLLYGLLDRPRRRHARVGRLHLDLLPQRWRPAVACVHRSAGPPRRGGQLALRYGRQPAGLPHDRPAAPRAAAGARRARPEPRVGRAVASA